MTNKLHPPNGTATTTLQNHADQSESSNDVMFSLGERLQPIQASPFDMFGSPVTTRAASAAIPSPDPSDLGDGNNHADAHMHYRKLAKTQSETAPKPTLARPASLARTISFAASMGGVSFRSANDHDHLIPPPSSAKDKSKMTRRYFATTFAIMYAVFLVIFGAVVFILDAIHGLYPVGEAFALYMIVVSFGYFLFLYIDIRLHVRKAKKTIKERERRQELFEEHLQKISVAGSTAELLTHSVITDQTIREHLKLPQLEAVSHKYCFMTGRHGEFFYLKFGAAWFALGLLIHSILQITYQVMFLTHQDLTLCTSYTALAMDIVFPLYSIFVLFFIFKYMNVIINEYRGVARLFLMHAIGTSLAMWIYTIVTETAGAIAIAEHIEEDIDLEDHMCQRPDVLNFIHRNISPYLYPFIIEFCILVVGIFYMIWANISHCPRKYSALGHSDEEHGGRGDMHAVNMEGGSQVVVGEVVKVEAGQAMSSASEEHCDNTADHDNQYKSTNVVFADCHASNRGMFAGLLLVVVTFVFIILFFIAVQNEDYLDAGILANNIFSLIVLVIMVITVIAAYVQTAKLDINHHPMSKLDDILLFIAIPAFFLETIFSLIPAGYNHSWLNMAAILAQLIQILIQTPFIIDGLRRCSNAAVLRRTKPGRELVTFLIIANVSVWLFLTFSVKTAYTGDERYIFYGYTLWNILNHISLPLIMFYRFHASVCLVDIWRHSYEPEPPAH